MDISEYFKKGITRRNILKGSLFGTASLVASGFLPTNFRKSLNDMVNPMQSEAEAMGCAQQIKPFEEDAPVIKPFEEDAPVIYPRLKGHKVQPPENGCYIGFHNDTVPEEEIFEHYKNQFDKGPSIIIPRISLLDRRLTFPGHIAKRISSEKAIPFLYKSLMDIEILYGGFKNLLSNKKFRENIEDYAKDAVEFGKPFFITTMREMNDPGTHRPWKGQSSKDVKEVWKCIWQIFEDTGANEYATWVWEIIAQENFKGMRNPERFYPGDKYVDWIGLSAWSQVYGQSANRSLNSITGQTYKQMYRNHREKPIMMAEFGKSKYGQAKWLKNAYEKIKSWPGMKAAIYWEIIESRVKSDLTGKSIEVLKQKFKDPYFIGVK